MKYLRCIWIEDLCRAWTNFSKKEIDSQKLMNLSWTTRTMTLFKTNNNRKAAKEPSIYLKTGPLNAVSMQWSTLSKAEIELNSLTRTK